MPANGDLVTSIYELSSCSLTRSFAVDPLSEPEDAKTINLR